MKDEIDLTVARSVLLKHLNDAESKVLKQEDDYISYSLLLKHFNHLEYVVFLYREEPE